MYTKDLIAEYKSDYPIELFDQFVRESDYSWEDTKDGLKIDPTLRYAIYGAFSKRFDELNKDENFKARAYEYRNESLLGEDEKSEKVILSNEERHKKMAGIENEMPEDNWDDVKKIVPEDKVGKMIQSLATVELVAGIVLAIIVAFLYGDNFGGFLAILSAGIFGSLLSYCLLKGLGQFLEDIRGIRRNMELNSEK